MSKDKSKKKICPVCKKPYLYQLRISYNASGRACRHDNDFKFSEYEITTRQIKSERETYKKDLLQPYKKDGSVNEHFQKIYGKNHNAYKSKNSLNRRPKM